MMVVPTARQRYNAPNDHHDQRHHPREKHPTWPRPSFCCAHSVGIEKVLLTKERRFQIWPLIASSTTLGTATLATFVSVKTVHLSVRPTLSITITIASLS
jgi:hypothetical protein